MAGAEQGVGEMSTKLLEILVGVEKMKVVENKVAVGVGNMELYVKEVAAVCKQLFHPMGNTLEQEPLSLMAMLAASGGESGKGSSHGI